MLHSIANAMHHLAEKKKKEQLDENKEWAAKLAELEANGQDRLIAGLHHLTRLFVQGKVKGQTDVEFIQKTFLELHTTKMLKFTQWMLMRIFTSFTFESEAALNSADSYGIKLREYFKAVDSKEFREEIVSSLNRANHACYSLKLKENADQTEKEIAGFLHAEMAYLTLLNFLNKEARPLDLQAPLAPQVAELVKAGKTLNLSFCNFAFKKSVPELVSAFAAIQDRDVPSLNLRCNNLGLIRTDGLAQILASTPSVTFLNLSMNKLNFKTSAELTKILAAIPKKVRILDLRGNYLHTKTGQELEELIDALLKTGKSIIVEEPLASELKKRQQPQRLAFLSGLKKRDDQNLVFNTFGATDGKPNNPLSEFSLIRKIFEFFPCYESNRVTLIDPSPKPEAKKNNKGF